MDYKETQQKTKAGMGELLPAQKMVVHLPLEEGNDFPIRALLAHCSARNDPLRTTGRRPFSQNYCCPSPNYSWDMLRSDDKIMGRLEF